LRRQLQPREGSRSVDAAGIFACGPGELWLDQAQGWFAGLTADIELACSACAFDQPAPALVPSAPAAPAGCHPRTPSGNCYEPGEFCSAAEHGETGVAGDGNTITCLASGSYWRWED
jgi:hypothetical protein